MNYIKSYPELLKLYDLNNDTTKEKIINKINQIPSSSDGIGYVYGYVNPYDSNTRNNFYIKLGRTERNPTKRISELSGQEVFSIRTIFNKKFERLVHLFLKFANTPRFNHKTNTNNIEWFRFYKENNIDKNYIISRTNEIKSLVEDLHLSNDDVFIPDYNLLNIFEIKKININICSQGEIMKIKGIGKILSKRIIDNRPYKNINEINNLLGFGPKRTELIRKIFDIL